MNSNDALSVHWEYLPFAELDAEKLFAILFERQTVFVLEQQCIYPDIDAKDKQAMHLIGWTMSQEIEPHVAAYLRILPPGASFEESSIGRVLVSDRARGHGLGDALMRQGLKHLSADYPHIDVRISAQSYLEKFYSTLGFKTISEIYDEDGIPHIDMLLKAKDLQQFSFS
ncbi:MAG: GNAT family N-acetyltransferase [Acidiferrobacterales bacterium]|nr:GNAT family N-acetyltransferase [Acidiferrobacterales bacterium]